MGMMNKVPIVFAFDNNLVLPAAVCISSLLTSARADTYYDIFILHANDEDIDKTLLNRVETHFSNCKISYRSVPDTFKEGFEIRGITIAAYYRLLIPELIPEYDKVIYSDVDVIFRQDLSHIYFQTDLGDCYIAGVNNLAHLDADLNHHYGATLGLDTRSVICSGFLLMDCKRIKADGLVEKFIEQSKNKYKFQDQDILNICCRGRIKMLPPKYSLLTYISFMAINRPKELVQVWSSEDIAEAMTAGNIHYNGQKPWRGACINFDIWWEYYRKSPVYDPKYYFDFFYGKLNELDSLPLVKRLKILARYFIYGKSKS